MPLDRRRLVIGVALFLMLMLVGAWPWAPVRVGFSRALSAIANPILTQVRFKADVQIELSPLPASSSRDATHHVEEDTHVILRMPGRPATGRVGLSLRRDAYLPLLIFVALLLAAPLGRREKALGLLIGVPVVIGVAVASICILVTYLLSLRPETTLPEWQRVLVTFSFERWLTPPGNRVIFPLLMAAVWTVALYRWPTRRTSGGSLPAMLVARPWRPRRRPTLPSPLPRS